MSHEEIEAGAKSSRCCGKIEVEIANGKNTPQACREAQITTQAFHPWRRDGGLKLDPVKRLKEPALLVENSNLKRLAERGWRSRF